jgi:hypothetical protein
MTMKVEETHQQDLKDHMMITEVEVEAAEVEEVQVAEAAPELASNATKKVTWQENALMKETPIDQEVVVEEELATNVIKKDIWLGNVPMKMYHLREEVIEAEAEEVEVVEETILVGVAVHAIDAMKLVTLLENVQMNQVIETIEIGETEVTEVTETTERVSPTRGRGEMMEVQSEETMMIKTGTKELLVAGETMKEELAAGPVPQMTTKRKLPGVALILMKEVGTKLRPMIRLKLGARRALNRTRSKKKVAGEDQELTRPQEDGDEPRLHLIYLTV